MIQPLNQWTLVLTTKRPNNSKCISVVCLLIKVNFLIFKGTIRPDWIFMRVVPLDRPWKGDQPIQVFDFLISLLNIWKDFKVLSLFMQKWIQPPACLDHGLHIILSFYWLAHFYLMKKSAKVLLYFDLDCEMLKFFTYEPWSNKQLMSTNNAFLKHGLAEKIAVWAHANRDPNK